MFLQPLKEQWFSQWSHFLSCLILNLKLLEIITPCNRENPHYHGMLKNDEEMRGYV
jgi:hypothetical protein